MRIKILLLAAGVGLTWPMAAGHADDYPTDRDFQVAYCKGAADLFVSSAPSGEAFAHLTTEFRERSQRLNAYLLSRGYPYPKTDAGIGLGLAHQRGQADELSFLAAQASCMETCHTRDLPAPGDPRTPAALKKVNACLNRCERQAGAPLEKLGACDELINALPF
ncbi:MAG TPA: hypothetical protein VN823_05970 [Stellaceae bacterium]|nr:hypothetical protein [Stellaceae bacterium]